MAAKTIHPVIPTILISAVTSILVTALGLCIYFRTPALQKMISGPGPAKTPSSDANFAKYEGIINNFLDVVRKGDLEKAYKETSPSFQKLTSFEDFKKLIAVYKEGRNIPDSACTVTEYGEPFTTTIAGLSDSYTIIQTKCEAQSRDGIKGFVVELIDDGSTLKVSFINAYNGPVIHKK